MPKEADPHTNFQIPGDLSPSVVLTVHHAAIINVFGHENIRKINKVTPVSATNLRIPNKS